MLLHLHIWLLLIRFWLGFVSRQGLQQKQFIRQVAAKYFFGTGQNHTNQQMRHCPIHICNYERWSKRPCGQVYTRTTIGLHEECLAQDWRKKHFLGRTFRSYFFWSKTLKGRLPVFPTDTANSGASLAQDAAQAKAFWVWGCSGNLADGA